MKFLLFQPTTQTPFLWIRLFTLILCFVLPAASSAQLADTKIAFSSQRDGRRRIYVMDADGKNLVRLTHNTPGDDAPAWSPDGTLIAFHSQRDGREIYVMDAEGKNQKNLTNIALQFNKVELAADVGPSWSPDGTLIAFGSNRDGKSEIYVMDADGKNPVNLTNHPADDYSPAWSPDGALIAFGSLRDGNSEIYVMDADGKNPVNLTNHPTRDSNPSWSPDGTKIAFISLRDGNVETYVMDADGKNPVNLTNHPADDYSPAWSPAPLVIQAKGKLATTWGRIKGNFVR